MPNQKVILLDRDGVININSDKYVKNLDELKIIEGSIKAISLLTQANFSIFVISNQSAIGRGLATAKNVEKIHDAIDQEVAREKGKINGYYFCPHRPNEDCGCRKPKTGMLQKIENDHAIELRGSLFIGDAFTDIELADNYDLKPILVRTGHGRETEENIKKDCLVFENLLEAVEQHILLEH